MLLKHLLSCLFLSMVQSAKIRSNSININHESHEVVKRANGYDPNQVEIKYITPNNVDEIVKYIQAPNWQEIKYRKKPFTIFVEGIVGTGKSTFLEPFKTYPLMEVLPEPVNKWTNLNGTDLLGLVYSNPYRWSLTQESYVQLTMLEEHLSSNKLIKAMERSIHSARNVFTEYFYQSKNMKPVEYALLDSWYNFLNDRYNTGFDLDGDMIIYLQADPVVVLDRIKKRGRPEEASISLEFLQGLNRLHEDWLIHGNSTARVPSKSVYVINTNYPLVDMMKIYRKIAHHIYRLIPSELLQQCY